VAAFRATLEEVVAADLILHVRDIAHPETEAQKADVETVLADLGIDANAADAPILEAWNKIDRLAVPDRRELQRAAARSGRGEILVSALDGTGLDRLLEAIDERLGGGDEVLLIDLPPQEGRLLNWLHENSELLSQDADDDGLLHISVRVDPLLRGKLEGLLKRANLTARAPAPPRRIRRRA
jgi:GTP-binding protein HflX